MTDDTNIELRRCQLDPDGNITCKVPKSVFDSVQQLGVKPKRLLLEIEG